jgi:cytochrome c oxidase accessory protein FixG
MVIRPNQIAQSPLRRKARPRPEDTMTHPTDPVEQTVFLSLYQAQEKIYPRAVTGLFARWRWVMVWITQLVFYGLPWLSWNDRQALLFNLDTRQFYLFGLVLQPQDFIYLAALLVLSALALFFFTAVAGRLWCGYTCPQTVYTEIFLWLERKIEGDRSARIRLDAQPLGLNKVLRKGGKQLAWLAMGLFTGFSFVGYFVPIHDLALQALTLNVDPWPTFWVFFYGFATYGNAGYLREQVCKYMCPYARFQSALIDMDSLVIAYDAGRGEGRGARSRKADPKALGLGDCIDCTLCVQVCPTGIDIRKGLQYECIGCAACVDVCDDVMDKVGYPRGLIRFSTQNGIAQGWNTRQMLQRAMRPRVLVYSFILLAITLAVGVSLFLRTPLKVDVIRDRGALARMVEQGRIENVFRLQIMNATESSQRYVISVSGLPGITLASQAEVDVLPTEVRSAAVRVQIPPDAAKPGSHPIQFEIHSSGEEVSRVTEKAAFVVPR